MMNSRLGSGFHLPADSNYAKLGRRFTKYRGSPIRRMVLVRPIRVFEGLVAEAALTRLGRPPEDGVEVCAANSSHLDYNGRPMCG